MKPGWATKTLDQISVNLDHKRVPITKSDRVAGQFPYYGASGVVDYVATYLFEGDALLVSEDGANLVARSSPIAFPATGRYWVNNHAHVLRFAEATTQRYVELYLESIRLDEYITGAAQPKLNQRALNSIPIPVAPPAEQRRIVAILDEAFEGIATTKATAEKNLQSTRELIRAGYQAIVGSFDQSPWSKAHVDELAAASKSSMRTGPFGSQLLHSEFVDNGIAVLGIDNAVANEFRWDKRRYITEAKYRDLTRYRVHPGDVLITIMGTCGRCAVVPDDIPLAINTKHLCCITLDRKKCLPDYLHLYFLHDPLARAYLTAQAKGSIMAGLNMGIISALPVRLPPLDQQACIVERFDSLQAECDRLAEVQTQKLTALDELKRSLLHQAFSGGLS